MGLLVVGAGGHAKVVVDAARAAGLEIAGVIGSPEGRTDLLGIPVSQNVAGIAADGFIVAIGDNAKRAAVFAEYLTRGLPPVTVVHPSAVIADGVAIGGGTLVAAGVVVNVDAVIGENAILNTACTIDHDCVVGNHSHIGPGANVCGECYVSDGVLVGVGAGIAPTRSVGPWSVVGAGAAVVRDIPGDTVCAGVPARVIRASSE